MANDETLTALSNLHLLDSAAREMLTAIDIKLDGVETDTVPVNVHALKLIRLIMSTQREALTTLVEKTLESNDYLESLMQQHGIPNV